VRGKFLVELIGLRADPFECIPSAVRDAIGEVAGQLRAPQPPVPVLGIGEDFISWCI
jgi:hypothetical protein